MTKTEQFEAELKALLKKYDVTITAELNEYYDWQEAKVNFFAYAPEPNDRVDLTVTRIDGELE